MSHTLGFTAAQIASALGSSRQVVQRVLATVPERDKQLVRGNEARMWSVASLPAPMLAKLSRWAKTKGYRNPEHLLSAPPCRFESPVPINQLAEPVQQRALKLRDALARPLADHANGLKGGALEELGLTEYKRAFAFEISFRHWRTLFNRTLARDAGEEQWQRLDLYIDERPCVQRKATALKMSPALREAEAIVLGYAAQVREPASPSIDEKALLWNVAFDQLLTLIESGIKLSPARKNMRRALWKCGVTLAKNETSLGQLWRVKEAAWRNAEGAISVLKDARSQSSGNHRTPEIPQKDIDTVIALAIRFDGRVSQAWRHALENRMFSSEVQSYYETFWHASKSYVPRTIRDAVTAETRLMRDIHHGPRAANLNGAYINRNWEKVAAGDWYQADDVTLNNYYYAPNGHGGLTLMRGQVLLMIDVRSTCILSFAILDQRNYTSHAIRTLITRTCDEHGLPRQGFYFERGIWENSKLLKGDASISSDDLTWSESEGGLRELGLRFTHSKNPRSKPVERVIGQLQNLLDGEPGDSGRNEMKDGFERLQERKRLVEAGHEPANKFFYSYDEWTERLVRYCEEYNCARNDGKMTRGLTPFQAWKNYQSEPLVKLPSEARYLLAHHKRPVTVGRNGITLKFGKQSFTYRNTDTGKLRGQRLLAWFNPELPELLAVTDMNRESCFTVERAEDVPAMDAPDDILQREMSRVAAHNNYPRQRYRTLARLANLNPRPTIMDHDTARLGRDITEQREEILVERKDRVKRTKAGRMAMNNLGLTPRQDEEITENQARSAKALAELLNEDGNV